MLLPNLLFDKIRDQLPRNLSALGSSQEILISHATEYTLNVRFTSNH